MNNIYIANWSDDVYAYSRKYGLGVEVQDFTIPKIIDNYISHAESLAEDLKGIQLRSVHGPFSEMVPASRDYRITEIVNDRFTKAYDACKLIGGKHLILHTGFIPKTYLPKDWLSNSISFWTEFLADKLDDIEIHIENVYEDDFALMKELVDSINNPKFSVCLDLGHVNANSSKTMTEWISGLGDRIRYVHMHNNEGVLDNHFGLWRGNIDMVKTLELLRIHAPGASWTIETVKEDIEQSIYWLADNGFINL
jgi:sugar phosphate isomerase/epimerase